jgi:hypothetical protein
VLAILLVDVLFTPLSLTSGIFGKSIFAVEYVCGGRHEQIVFMVLCCAALSTWR